MRQESVTYNVYKFNELSEKVQEKVLQNLWDINAYDDWYEFTVEDYKEKLEAIGFEDPKIYFSGFCSQGDGACFDAYINLEKIVQHLGDKRFNKLIHLIQEGYISACIGKTSYACHYSHQKTRYIDFTLDFSEKYKRLWKLCYTFMEYVEELRLDLSHDIYRSLEKEYYYLTSKEAIIETIEANDYDFLENGKIF